MNLRKPIALITENIGNEIVMCEKHEKRIKEFTGDIQQLEKELYTPALDIISEPLAKPITVCSDPDCCEKKSCGNTTKVHYKSICHKPCYLKTNDGNIIGNAGLLDCIAFNKYETVAGAKGRWSRRKEFHADIGKLKFNKQGFALGYDTVRTKSETCFQCSHSYQVHLRINYETKIETKQIRDENKFERIETSKQNIDRKQLQIDLIKAKVEEIKEELHFITVCSAYFARFLMKNAITPFNDALEEYINYCVAIEKEGNGDASVVKGFLDMLEAYNREKATIEKLSKETGGECELSSDQIDAKIEQLFELKHYGHVIKHHMDLEAQGQQSTKVALERDAHMRTDKTTESFRHIFSEFQFTN